MNLTIVPPFGSSDEVVIPANLSATELAKPIWPSILDSQTCKIMYINEIKTLLWKLSKHPKFIWLWLTGLEGVMSSTQEAIGNSPPQRSLFHPPPKIQEPWFASDFSFDFLSNTRFQKTIQFNKHNNIYFGNIQWLFQNIHFIRILGIANDALSAQLLFIIKSDLYQIVSRSHHQ